MQKAARIIGICLSRVQEEYRLQCIKAFKQHASAKGYRLFIFNAKSDFFLPPTPTDFGEMTVYQLIPYDLLDAMILFPDTIYRDSILNDILENCRSRQIPVLTIDKALEGCINFRFDYANSFEKLCRHVVEVHHARTLFMLAGFAENNFSNERIAAFQKVLQEYGLSQENCRIAYGDFWEKPAIEAMEKWFVEDKLPIPDAIICANDTMAITASQFLQNLGYRIPEDCIITGFDGISHASYHVPHLTTCTQDYDTMGRLVIEAVEKLWLGQPVEPSTVVDFYVRFSQSCGCEAVGSVNVNTILQNVLNQLKLSLIHI